MQKYLIVPARTSSEWDSIEFATILVTEEKIKQISELVKDLQPLKEKYGVSSASIFDDNVEFWAGCENDTRHEEIQHALEHSELFFVDEENEEIWEKPENRMDTQQLKVYNDGDFKYTAYGKHSGEEFWFDDVNIKSLIEEFNKLEG